MTLLIKIGYNQRIKIKNRYGALFLLDPFNYIDSIVLKEGYYESEVLECLLIQTKPNEVFWDVGANIGLHSITLNHLKKNVQIFSFEPFPSIMNNLLVNAELNQSTIHKISVGLSDKLNISAMHFLNGNSGMTTLEPFNELIFDDQVRITTFTIDNLIEQYRIPEPQVIKIDTEGSELNVINGAQNLLRGANLHSIIFEADNDFLLHRSELRSILESYRFKFTKLNRVESTSHNLSNFLASR